MEYEILNRDAALRPHQTPFIGIAPELLMEQVKNTSPFLFSQKLTSRLATQAPYITELQNAASLPGGPASFPKLDTARYFKLCLSAHYGTVATFVPTDVDVHIREKLWRTAAAQDESVVVAMATTVLEARHWDVKPVSTRYVTSSTGSILSGHMGEWFSVAAAAFGALEKMRSRSAAAQLMLEEIKQAIADEVSIHEEFFKTLLKNRDGVNLLKTSTIIAHNLGDLDRVLEAWHLHTHTNGTDGLAQSVYKRGHCEDEVVSIKSINKSPLLVAGYLNKAMMAFENHRHYPLRAARGLRMHQDLLLPTAPFLDDWGAHVARHPGLSDEEKGEAIVALIDGFVLINGKQPPGAPPVEGYARGLRGLTEAYPGGMSRLNKVLPAKAARALNSGPLKVLISQGKMAFERRLAERALKLITC